MENNLEKEYFEHNVFKQLDDYAKFYNDLSFGIMLWLSQGTKAIANIDTYVYSSMRGTIISIKNVLLDGRINDAYALLRKYYDSSIINVYSNLYLQDHFSVENIIVEKIDNWRSGAEKIPEYRIMSKYIKDSPKLQEITTLLQNDTTYKDIRDRCNDHMHYNYYKNLLLNDNQIHSPARLPALNTFSKDVEDIFIQHIAYIFYLNDHYMMASDYRDSLDIGITTEEGSEYFVAPYIQSIFDNIIKLKRPDIAAAIKNKTSMQLD